ncbi:hypothetical protein [Undibacterium sp. RuRC25W]|uniref:hypothetical protein n=1 Tax=Undibacterium sp. RuRC25W TaxID=3413047 RepID=UPI003BF058AA
MASALFFGNACAMASLSIPQGQQEKSPAETAQSTTVASDNQQSVSYNWDRSGVDRASVHLQILMQSSALFNENTAVANTQKKSNIAAKKNPPKAASST